MTVGGHNVVYSVDAGQEPVWTAYNLLADSEDYKHHAEYRADFDSKMSEMLSGISAQLVPYAKQVNDEVEEIKRSSKQAKISVVIFVVAAGFALASGVLFFMIWDSVLAFRSLLLFVLIPLAVLLLVVLIVNLRLLRRMRDSLLKWDNAVLRYKQKLFSLVRESFNIVINEVLGPLNKLTFPVEAPRLVELSMSAIVPSSSALYLRDFVVGHESSAIGIAGPRGSGKTTLMRSLQADTSLRPVTVSLTAPVRHDATEFVRRLYLDVAYAVVGADAGKTAYLSRKGTRPSVTPTLLLTLMSIGAGVILIALDLMPREVVPVMNLGPWGLTGGAFLLYGVFSYVFLLGNSRIKPFGTWARSREGQGLAESAASAITRLSFDVETSSKNKRAVKLLGDKLTIDDEDSITLKDRPLSQTDLVGDLRNLLRAFAYSTQPSPLLIIIDELDKLSKTEDLVDMVNVLKDLFHIENVHFVIAVSTDALRRFEQRGLSARDAFDSSFDEIIRVNPLSLDESLRVIAARAEGFPPLVGAFCHAWSGGLPRDLLRIARRCVGIQRAAGGELSIEALVKEVMAEDIIASAEAEIRAPDATDERRKTLMTVRQQGMDLKTAQVFSNASWERVPSAEALESAEALQSVAALSKALAHLFSLVRTASPSDWLTPDSGRDAFETAALAMSARSEPAELRTQYFVAALRALEAKWEASKP